uniref:Uncharacterized protein n=1 Tax=Anopheles minimus TaxID=112268 RepID=A0A182WBZ9_9DIPT
MCLLLMSTTWLLVLSLTGVVNAAPQQQNTQVPAASGATTKRNTYSPIADIGRLAQGATGFFGQFWNTGTRIVICAAPTTTAPEKEETTTPPEPKDDSPSESVETPDVKTDDHQKDRPDMNPMEFVQNVIKAVMDRVFPGAKNIPEILPFSF